MIQINGEKLMRKRLFPVITQKGTIGIVLKASDIMFSREGLSPDIILNPNAIPS